MKTTGPLTLHGTPGWHAPGGYYYYYYYHYYRKKRFPWHNVKRLQGHLTSTKQNSTSAAERAKYLSDTDGGRAVGIRKASSEQFHLKDASEDNDVRDASKLFHARAAATAGENAIADSTRKVCSCGSISLPLAPSLTGISGFEIVLNTNSFFLLSIGGGVLHSAPLAPAPNPPLTRMTTAITNSTKTNKSTTPLARHRHSPCVVFMICTTQVNTQTHTDTQTAFD